MQIRADQVQRENNFFLLKVGEIAAILAGFFRIFGHFFAFFGLYFSNLLV
jgi:hypothetical protein